MAAEVTRESDGSITISVEQDGSSFSYQGPGSWTDLAAGTAKPASAPLAPVEATTEPEAPAAAAEPQTGSSEPEAPAPSTPAAGDALDNEALRRLEHPEEFAEPAADAEQSEGGETPAST